MKIIVSQKILDEFVTPKVRICGIDGELTKEWRDGDKWLIRYDSKTFPSQYVVIEQPYVELVLRRSRDKEGGK